MAKKVVFSIAFGSSSNMSLQSYTCVDTFHLASLTMPSTRLALTSIVIIQYDGKSDQLIDRAWNDMT